MAEILPLAAPLVVALIFSLIFSCSTSSGLADMAMPDRLGVGQSFGKGDYSGRSVSNGATTMETGTEDLSVSALWLEWDLPSLSDDPRASVADLRDRVVEDYTAYREPEPVEALISITKNVDEVTGEESWSLGAGAALTSALTGLLGFLGYKFMRGRTADQEEASETG